ncbi:GNAT family N-acetyltransferase [Kaarinaea lacus]
MQIVTPQFEQEWQSYYDLRWRLLREPWQQAKGSEQDELEQNAYHVMAISDKGDIVGVGRIHSNSAEEWQIRYMAVDEAFCRQGIGSRILKRLESHAQSQGAKRIILHAREAAVNFYLHHNYQVTGDAHTLYDVIKHKSMQKIL